MADRNRPKSLFRIFRSTFLVPILSTTLITACNSPESEMTGGQGPKVRETLPPPSDGSGSSPPEHQLSAPVQALGFYSEGKIVNEFFFPLEGLGLVKVFRARKRNFSTNHLYDVISYAAAEVSKLFPKGERLQIGDISKSKGGQLSLHASHQNGLDADLAYFRINQREMDPEGFGKFDEIFVRNNKVTSNFDLERNYEIMKLFVSTGVVNRIFVDAAIKTRFCELSQGQPLTPLDKETLRRLRPLTNHHDHMHLRVKCPLTSPDCITQVEPPDGTGCPAPGQVLINMLDVTEE